MPQAVRKSDIQGTCSSARARACANNSKPHKPKRIIDFIWTPNVAASELGRLAPARSVRLLQEQASRATSSSQERREAQSRSGRLVTRMEGNRLLGRLDCRKSA